MGGRKTIYLNDDDAAFIEAHREVIGESLSSTLMEGLRMVVAKRELAGMGFEEIRLDIGRPGASKMKVFNGRLMARSSITEQDGAVRTSRRIYTTPKNAWVYFERSSVNWNYWTSSGSHAADFTSFDPSDVDNHRVFEIRQTLAELESIAPPELLSEARTEADDAGGRVERLDI
jgi:EXLDI family protein